MLILPILSLNYFLDYQCKMDLKILDLKNLDGYERDLFN